MTASVDVPVVRTIATIQAAVSTNTLQVVYPDGEVKTTTIYWASGESKTNVTVDVGSKVTSTNTPIELILLDAAGVGVATNHITIVSGLENSPKNPLWIGEKSSVDLNWGEWTMDLDAATNKVNDYNVGTGETTSGNGSRSLKSAAASPKDRAYTFIYLAGSLWCPDCKKTDEHLIAQDKFKQWAQTNKVACVVLDLPSADDPNSTAPCLLTAEPGLSFSLMATASGASYLSRKKIDKGAAADILARNWDLAQKLRVAGSTKKYRPNLPAFVVLRDDGTVAGRIEYFGRVHSPEDASDLDAHIERLNELLRQVDDPDEKVNDNWSTTTESIGIREVVGTNSVKTISFADSADVYRLDPETTAGKRMAFTVTGETDVTVQLSLRQVTADSSVEVAAARGKLSDEGGVTLGATIPSTNCYISVNYTITAEGVPDDDYFKVGSTNSTVCPYVLSTDFVVEPTELASQNQIKITDGVNEVMVNLVSNQLYRITNLDTMDDGNRAVLKAEEPATGSATDLYRAIADGDVRLKLAASESDIQKWNPGTVGFVTSRRTVQENAWLYNIQVVRSGGLSGTASLTLSLDNDATTYPDLVNLSDDFQKTFTWVEGEDDIKEALVLIVENDYADGDQNVVFRAEAEGDAPPGLTSFVLVIRDNDKPMPGKVAIVDTTPAMAKSSTVFARAGTDVVMWLKRIDGTSGIQDVTLTASGGSLDSDVLVWPNRNYDAQPVTLTLPDAGTAVKVTLTPKEGSFVDASRRFLTVNILDANAPGFVTDAMIVSATRYIPIPATSIALDDKATGDTMIKKYSGSLPPGVKWSVVDDGGKKLVFDGVPTSSGIFTAVFRAFTGSTEGLTVAVTFFVMDPVVEGGSLLMDSPLNAAVAKSRTLADIPVLFADTNRLAGVLTLTLPRNGRASAKFRSVEYGTVSFSSKSWDAIDEDSGLLSVTLTGKAGDATMTLTATVAADGTVALDMGADYTCILPGTTWSAANPAKDFKGYYTVNLHPTARTGVGLASGDGYLTLKMNTSATINVGKFEYAGVLPNGQAISGSSVLTAADWTETAIVNFWKRGLLPILQLSSADTVAGLVQLTPGAWDPTATNMVEGGMSTGRSYYKTIRRSVRPAAEAAFLWQLGESGAALEGETVFDVNGTYYVQTENFASCCVASIGSSTLKFFLLDGINDVPDGVMDDLVAETVDISKWKTPGVKVTSKAANKKKTSWKNALASQNTKVLTMSFAAATGIISGTFAVDGVKMTYKGVVMPGWGAQDCTACGPATGTGGAEAKLRPFVSGTAWFNDTLNYTDAYGRGRTAKVRRSLPFTIGAQAGE